MKTQQGRIDADRTYSKQAMRLGSLIDPKIYYSVPLVHEPRKDIMYGVDPR
jgi:hypothetical protein